MKIRTFFLFCLWIYHKLNFLISSRQKSLLPLTELSTLFCHNIIDSLILIKSEKSDCRIFKLWALGLPHVKNPETQGCITQEMALILVVLPWHPSMFSSSKPKNPSSHVLQVLSPTNALQLHWPSWSHDNTPLFVPGWWHLQSTIKKYENKNYQSSSFLHEQKSANSKILKLYNPVTMFDWKLSIFIKHRSILSKMSEAF